MDLRKEATALQEYMAEIRHELHKYPELSMQEFETTNRIERELNKLGLQCRRFAPTGLMTEIKGEGTGTRTVALRADIDALPIKEETDLPFASVNDGVMHACGHDVHTSMLLGAAKLLLNHKADINGTVRLLFQPGEECGKGASTILEQGAGDGVDYFFGMHIMEFTSVGTIAGRSGPQMAGAEEFKITVRGAAHHGGMPQMAGGVDATLIACEIVTALQSIVSRRIDPLEGAVVSVGSLQSGSAANIISGLAEMTGTIRYQSEEVHEIIKKQMCALTEGIAKAHGADAELSFANNICPVINDDWVTKIAFDAARKVTGDPKKVLTVRGTTGSEDFGAYSKNGRACFLTVGVESPFPGHSPKLNIKEDAMPYGAAMMAQTAIDLLANEEV